MRFRFRHRGAGLSAWCYGFAWAATLVDQFLGLRAAGMAAGLAMALFLLLEFRRQRRYAQVVFLGLLAIGLCGVAISADPLALFLESWRRGAVYGAFFLALSSLRDAAETSPLVRRCGRHLVAQPPGRRYAALTAGGHLFGIILSYGAVELLAAMVVRANTVRGAGGSADERQARTRRMLMAIFRGFCVMNCWNPLNLMTAVVATAVPAAPMRALLPLALAVALGMLALGWLEDRLSAGRQARDGRRPGTAETWAIHGRIVALVVLVLLLAEAASLAFHVTLVASVTLVVPLVGLAWAVAQARRFPRPAGGHGGMTRAGAVMARRARRFLRRMPGFRGEATVLAASGFMGVAVGGALPASGLAPLIAHLPPLLIPLLVPVLLICTGQVGLNPVAVVALLGAAIPDPGLLGVPPAVLAFACMLGWGLAVNMTPMSASAIITARWAGVSPWTIASRWNAAYTLSSLLLAWAAIALLFVFRG